MNAEEEASEGAPRMRAGMREALVRLGARLRHIAPRTLLALLAASAFAPVIAATGGIAGAGLLAGFGVVGGVGTNVLTELISDVISHFREKNGGREPTQAEVERELAARIEAALEAADERAQRLQTQLALTLQEAGISQAAVEAVVESGNEELRTDIQAAYAALSAELTDFGFLLSELIHRVEWIQKQLNEDSTQLALMQKSLVRIERNTRYSYGVQIYADNEKATADAVKFEERYRGTARDLWGRVEVFGLNLRRVPRRLSLDAVYVRLLLEQTGYGGGLAVGMNLPDLLSRRKRVLVEGAAGSGKSTLLRHLGLRALDGELTGDSPGGSSLIPFLLKLRSFVHGDMFALPQNAEDFVGAVFPQLGSDKPAKWVYELLDKGRAVILLDGIDEIKEAHRSAVIEWLDQYKASYPEARYVVTSRPAAIEEQWREKLRDFGFSTVRLEPMTDAQAQEFVERWYRAAAASAGSNPYKYEDPERIRQLSSRLRAELAERADLRNLAASPLLCAVICAIYLDRGGMFATRRSELYEAALKLLLERRDVGRGIRSSDHLAYHQSREMLSRIALWMLMNGQDAIPNEAALTAIADIADRSGASPRYMKQQLLEQTGLVQETGRELVEFRYSSFQDYLAAAEIIRQYSIEYLIINSYIPTYHDVTVNAMELADSATGQRILAGLIERAEQEPEPSRAQQLWLVAADCLNVSEDSYDLAGRIHAGLARAAAREP